MRLRDALTDPGGGFSNSTGLFDEPGWGLDLLVQCYFDPGPAAGEGSRASQRVLDRGRITSGRRAAWRGLSSDHECSFIGRSSHQIPALFIWLSCK